MEKLDTDLLTTLYQMLELPLLSPEVLSLGIFLVPFLTIVIAVFSFRVWGFPAYLGALSGRGGTLFLGFTYILLGLNLASVLATPDQIFPTIASLQDMPPYDPLFLPFGMLIFVIGSLLFLYTFLQGKPARETILESVITVGGFFLFVYLARFIVPV
ncbi:MAG: hypothetical protein LUQ40_00290 [Methanomicrobiales archaeon]|nr:hypothetical protein [Methanomicrobiales archaeon]